MTLITNIKNIIRHKRPKQLTTTNDAGRTIALAVDAQVKANHEAALLEKRLRAITERVAESERRIAHLETTKANKCSKKVS
jgi:hypothetical protein